VTGALSCLLPRGLATAGKTTTTHLALLTYCATVAPTDRPTTPPPRNGDSTPWYSSLPYTCDHIVRHPTPQPTPSLFLSPGMGSSGIDLDLEDSSKTKIMTSASTPWPLITCNDFVLCNEFLISVYKLLL